MLFKVHELIGRTAVSRESGLVIRNAIIKQLTTEDVETIVLDFVDVEIYASPFFNTSIAPLLENMSIDDLKNKLRFENITPLGRFLLNQVIHNAIEFYAKSEEEQNKIHDNLHDHLD